MKPFDTLLLQRKDIADLLDINDCMDVVEKAFELLAQEKVLPPKVLGVHVANGGFHIKAGVLGFGKDYFAAKLNANFPQNPRQHDLPSIQGVLALCDVLNGCLLSLMDSIEITIVRTGAATGIAAKYLAHPDATVATICGCGNQGTISLKALLAVRKIKKVFAFDIDKDQRETFAREFGNQLEIIPIDRNELPTSLIQSHIVVTCTPSKDPFIQKKDIARGTFIAAVGADSEEKQELFPELLASSKVVADLIDQAAAIGELHHAINKGLMTTRSVHAELGEIIAGLKPGRETSDEIIIFDSTGTALQDVAAAAIVYEKAISNRVGQRLALSFT